MSLRAPSSSVSPTSISGPSKVDARRATRCTAVVPSRRRRASVPTIVAAAALHLAGGVGCRRAPPPPGAAAASLPAASAVADVRPDGAFDPCRIEGSRLPLLARWTAAQRAALNDAMSSGIAVVAADDCRGVRLLAGCRARGRYGYLEQTPQTRAVELSTDEELRVNAPFADAQRASDAEPPGLHATVVIVGHRATVRSLLSPAELSGDCQGATHFVQSASVGRTMLPLATSLPTGSRDPCRAPGDGAPPAACATLVEIHIDPIQELGELITFDHAPAGTVAPIGMCPRDMVVSRSQCVRAPVSAPYLCAFGDAAGCREQCDRGDENSCDVLAFMLWHGQAGSPDFAAAATLYSRTCDLGDAIACSNLGGFRFEGKGGSKDQTQGAALFDRACRLGSSSACGDLGLAYTKGLGVVADVPRGMGMLRHACDAGSLSSCEQLARQMLAGEASGGDAAKGRALLDELCEVDSGTACWSLARIHYLGDGVPRDLARGAALFEKACRTGSDPACVMLGLVYRQGDGVKRDDVFATQMMARACSHGDQEGCHNLGIAYENGKGIARDLSRAAALYEQACAARVARACLFRADLASGGVGVSTDGPLARQLYARACELGEEKACAKAR